jgi:hypothetical protein
MYRLDERHRKPAEVLVLKGHHSERAHLRVTQTSG